LGTGETNPFVVTKYASKSGKRTPTRLRTSNALSHFPSSAYHFSIANIIMMQSVALTESFYVRDDDFVVVEMPRSMNRHLGSIFDIVGDGVQHDEDGTSESEKRDDDGDNDASYDYCDDFTIQEKVTPSFPPTSELISTSAGVNVNLSFVVNDDDVSSSMLPPSLSGDGNHFAKQDVFSDNISDLSLSIQEGSSDVEVSVDPPTESGTVSIVSEECIGPKPEPLAVSVDDNGYDRDSSEKELKETPKETNPVMELVEVTSMTIESKPENGEKISRLSNKKRRKQLKLAKKAAAAATAVSKLSVSSKTKTRRLGKQVAPTDTMDPSRDASQ
jgi:hypothetical protein